jgi:hypothetical protein
MTRTDTANGALTRSAGVCRERIGIRDIDGLPLRAIPAAFDARSALDQRALSGYRSPHSHAGLVAERECPVMPLYARSTRV